MTTPTPDEIQQANVGMTADLVMLIVNLRAQIIADQREITDLRKQLDVGDSNAATS